MTKRNLSDYDKQNWRKRNKRVKCQESTYIVNWYIRSYETRFEDRTGTNHSALEQKAANLIL